MNIKSGLHHRSLYAVNIINFLFVTVFFFPQFRSYVGLLFEQLLLIGLTICSLFILTKRKTKLPILSFIIFFIYLTLLNIDLIRSFKFTITNDYFELIKPFSFFLFFGLGYSWQFTEDKILTYSKRLMFLFLIISIIGILEARTSFVNRLCIIFYKDSRWVFQYKAIVSFLTTYCLAAILVLPLFYNFILFFAEKKIIYLFISIIILICILFTQSKTVFLSVLITAIIFFFVILNEKWLPNRRIFLFSIVLIVVLISFSMSLILSIAETKFNYLYDGLEKLFSSISSMNLITIMSAQTSTRLRFEQLQFVFENQDLIPIIGVAIGKKVLMPESFYAMYLYRTGLLGTIIHVLFIYFAAKKAIIYAKYYALKNKLKLSAFYLSIFIFFISLIFSSFSSALTDQTRIAFIFYFIVGHIYKLPCISGKRNTSITYQ